MSERLLGKEIEWRNKLYLAFLDILGIAWAEDLLCVVENVCLCSSCSKTLQRLDTRCRREAQQLRSGFTVSQEGLSQGATAKCTPVRVS